MLVRLDVVETVLLTIVNQTNRSGGNSIANLHRSKFSVQFQGTPLNTSRLLLLLLSSLLTRTVED